ncbi:hypothetical protein LNV09_17630 [Paucibacter sp. B2R-40]|uniref:hypothetical protein n=1 Tax=Paucibacter sp. B2R-40 TaxID=2893554 RepID=UPI0021E515ED|nr:hypothetical protein [Paucibacter sp. B2R-40]MCV2355966.1 hypothetical protein [Paucibacter sp. B2R-40]
MSFSKLQDLGVPTAWAAHLKDSYKKCRGDHTDSWYSWAKTQFRSGNRADTAVATTGHVATAGGVVTGALALPGASTVAAAAFGTAAGAATLYALPLVITAAAIAYWGYKKSEKNKINKEIWDFWTSKVRGQPAIVLSSIPKEKYLLWLGWFADEGIANMNHMGAKNEEAKQTFDKKYNAIKSDSVSLEAKISLFNRPGLRPPTEAKKRAEELKRLNDERDKLALKFIDLGKDLQYIIYRVERFLMYHAMLDLTVRGLESYTDVVAIERDAQTAFTQQTDSYKALRDLMALLPPAK